jgi:hypothetical protein
MNDKRKRTAKTVQELISIEEDSKDILTVEVEKCARNS